MAKAKKKTTTGKTCPDGHADALADFKRADPATKHLVLELLRRFAKPLPDTLTDVDVEVVAPAIASDVWGELWAGLDEVTNNYGAILDFIRLILTLTEDAEVLKQDTVCIWRLAEVIEGRAKAIEAHCTSLMDTVHAQHRANAARVAA